MTFFEMRTSLPLNDDAVLVKRTRRRSGDIAAVQIILPVMARTPDQPEIFLILNRAFEVCAGCRKCTKSPPAVRIRITGFVPNFTILPESFSISLSFPAFTLVTSTSPVSAVSSKQERDKE